MQLQGDVLSIDNKSVKLSNLELKIFKELASGPLSSKELLDKIYTGDKRPANTHIRVMISKMRKKFDALDAGEIIITERPLGYKLVNEVEII